MKSINILDVCVGIGYNSACIFEALSRSTVKLKWLGLEIDRRPLQIALENKEFKKSWSPEVLTDLTLMSTQGKWNRKNSQGKILWGDAREKINCIPKSCKFDLILLDPFSPKKCPQLWSEEFLETLVRRMTPNGRLTTYCRAAAIRLSLRKAGLKLISIEPSVEKTNNWSDGTIGILSDQNKDSILTNNTPFRNLSEMEEEHLLTKAAIPYRDPSGRGNSEEILKRRELEQSLSDMKSTNKWKKKWNGFQAG